MMHSGFIAKEPSLPVPKFAHSAAVCGSKIVITGGTSEIEVILDDIVPYGDLGCFMYDIYDKNWEKLPDLPVGRLHATLIVINNRYLFKIGGFQSRNFEIFRFDMRKPNKPWVTLTLDTNQTICDTMIYDETLRHLSNINELNRVRAEHNEGRYVARDSEDDSDSEQQG